MGRGRAGETGCLIWRERTQLVPLPSLPVSSLFISLPGAHHPTTPSPLSPSSPASTAGVCLAFEPVGNASLQEAGLNPH
eukprot:1870867-Pyramimonas_sp.AAC.1